MVKAPSIDVLRTWQRPMSVPELPKHEFFVMLPPGQLARTNSASSGGGRDAISTPGYRSLAGTESSSLDLAIVNNGYHWSTARLNMDLVFLLDRGRCSRLRAYLKE